MSNERGIVVLSRDAYSIVMFPVDPAENDGDSWLAKAYLRNSSWVWEYCKGRGFGETVEALDAYMRDHFVDTGEMVEKDNMDKTITVPHNTEVYEENDPLLAVITLEDGVQVVYRTVQYDIALTAEALWKLLGVEYLGRIENHALIKRLYTDNGEVWLIGLARMCAEGEEPEYSYRSGDGCSYRLLPDTMLYIVLNYDAPDKLRREASALDNLLIHLLNAGAEVGNDG